MSKEKSAAFLNTLANFAKSQKNLVVDEIKRTRPHHVLAAKDPGFTMHNWVIGALADKGAFGARATQKGLQKLKYRMSQVDTGLGALLRGNADKNSLRYKIFTDIRGSMIPVKQTSKGKIMHDLHNKSGQGLTQQLDRASVSAPVKAVSAPLVTGLAFTKADEILQRNRSNKSQGGTNA